MTTPQTQRKSHFRGVTGWRRKARSLTYGTLLCFGIPLLPPAGILLGLAFGTQSTFGIFHICGILLMFVSVSCISIAILLVLVRGQLASKAKTALRETQVPPPISLPRIRPDSPSSQSSSSGSRSFRTGKASGVSMSIDNEVQYRSRKKRKRKHGKHSKLPPVKEEDGRLKFEKAIEDRARLGRVHKRTKSLTRKGRDEYRSEEVCQTKLPLTQKHLQMLNNQHQGSQSSLQMKRSLSMSDIGDSASERLSVDFSDSPRASRRIVVQAASPLIGEDHYRFHRSRALSRHSTTGIPPHLHSLTGGPDTPPSLAPTTPLKGRAQRR